MAKVKGGLIRGVLGPFVYRVVKGEQLVSARLGKGEMKQTKETKKSANTFGMASSLSAAIRRTWEIPFKLEGDDNLKQRLTGQLFSILHHCRDKKSRLYQFEGDSFSGLEGFELNVNSRTGRYLSKVPVIGIHGNQLKVMLPELKIPEMLKFPYQSFRCVMTIGVSLFRLKEGLMMKRPLLQELTLMNNGEKTTAAQELTFEIPEGCLCIVGLFLEYSQARKFGWKPVTTLKFNPACILGAFITPGAYHGGYEKQWNEMLRFT